ncbi:GTP-binding protein TypA, partial [Candidatus Beckwithbacteria bacterium RBG_13_42_9]
MDPKQIRNIAIIAHVDHGKTTLVDFLLKQAHVFADYQAEMQQTTILDSQELERERGVTILAKNTAVEWHGYKINILDTPGHADFSGEVERVLNMADGCLLLVDAAEGVLSQTRYVLSLALRLNLKPIVVVNKVDRKDQRAQEVLEEINNLFLELATDTNQLDFPVFYAVGKEGVVGTKTLLQPDHSLKITDAQDLKLLFSAIIEKIPQPQIEEKGGFQLQVTTLDYDSHKGRYVIGKVRRGQAKQNDPLVIVRDGKVVGQGRAEYIFTFKGLKRQEVVETNIGDIMAITGFRDARIGDTITSAENPEGLPALMIAEPTIQLEISTSNSPLVGQDGEFTTSRQIGQRLTKELETNVSLRLTPGSTGNHFIVAGRGELHLSILIETMRREDFEFSVSRPQVIFRHINGVECEPWEMVTVEVPENLAGVVLDAMGQRKAQMMNMQNFKNDIRFEYKIATRNLIGFRSELLTRTSGLGIVHSLLLGYEPKG